MSGITEGKQTLIGVIDTSTMDKELEEKALLSARTKKTDKRGKNIELQRRHSIGGADMQLILQNAAESSSSKTEPALRRVDSSPTLRRNRSGGSSLSSSLMTNTTGAVNTNSGTGTGTGTGTPLGSARRSSKDFGRVVSLSGISNGSGSNAGTPSSTPRNQPPSMSRQSSTGSDDNNAKSANLEEICLKRASKNIKKMPGRTIASIKNNPKYGICSIYVLPFLTFLVYDGISLFLLLVPAFSGTTWHDSNHHPLPNQSINQSSIDTQYSLLQYRYA